MPGVRNTATGVVQTSSGVAQTIDIPSSVVVQNYATTWSQGDSTWVDDATSDGSQDMSLTGDPQATTLSDGAESVKADGTDDYGTIPIPPELEGGDLNQFSIEFTIEHSSTNTEVAIGCRNSDTNQKLLIFLNSDETLSSDPGTFQFRLDDDNSNKLRLAPSTNPNLDDGNRHDVSIIVNDASANDVDIIIDGSSQSLNFDVTQSPSSFTTWDTDLGVFVRNTSGTVDNYADIKLGAIRLHGSAINSQTISDYP
jgi:hypothetical protein